MPFEFKGSDTSLPVHIQNGSGAVAISIPASGVTGTSFDVQGSFDGTNYFNIYNDGVKLSIAVVVSSINVIRPSSVFGIPFLRLKSTASETVSIGLHFAEIVK